MHDCLIAFGSNEGNRIEIFHSAIQKFQSTDQIQDVCPGEPVETQPVGAPDESDQQPYLNAAIRLMTTLDVQQLHARLIEIENELGRERKKRWGKRKIDLDLLLFGDAIVESKSLVVPHPRMSFRRFVLEPSRRIAGDMVHARSGLSIEDLIKHLDECDDWMVIIGNSEFRPRFDKIQTVIKSKYPQWILRYANACEFQNEVEHWDDLPKLVAYFVDSVASPAIPEFSGPTLELPENQELAEIELRAAIEAMES